MSWRGEQAIGSRGPNQAYGYYAGQGPQAGGSGSGMGQSMSGIGQLAAGQGVTVGNQTWHPTVLYLAALVVIEMVIFGYVAKILK
jgi:hypothetical protein